jgi:hypothetical protein
VKYKLEIELNGLPDLQGLRYAHWARRYKHDSEWKARVGFAARQIGLPKKPLKKATAVFTRYSPKCPDHENLANSFKACCDGLIGLVIEDDGPTFLDRYYAWEKAGRGSGKISIVVTGEVHE